MVMLLAMLAVLLLGIGIGVPIGVAVAVREQKLDDYDRLFAHHFAEDRAEAKTCDGCGRTYQPESEGDRGLCCICERDARMEAADGPEWREHIAAERYGREEAERCTVGGWTDTGECPIHAPALCGHVIGGGPFRLADEHSHAPEPAEAEWERQMRVDR